MSIKAMQRMTNTTPARAPTVLVPLIKREWAAGTSGERDAVGRFRAAGDLLLEAKRNPALRGQFIAWVSDNFSFSYDSAKLYMRMASQKGEHVHLSVRRVKRDPSTRRQKQKPRRQKIEAEPASRTVEVEASPQESQRVRAMAIRVVQTGFKALVPQFHPDRPGGSVEQMSVLNHVREWLLDLINDSTVTSHE